MCCRGSTAKDAGANESYLRSQAEGSQAEADTSGAAAEGMRLLRDRVHAEDRWPSGTYLLA